MPTPLRKQLSADELTVAAGERAVVANISTMSLDRDGEVLLPAGCDAGEFERSPTVFFNHDYRLPVGRCAGLRRGERTLEAKTLFAVRPEGHEGTWLPDVLLSLFQQQVIRGFSVGFLPLESRRPSHKDREQFGPQVRRVYSKWKLLEYSVAPLPANQDALALAVSKGVLGAEDARRWFGAEAPAVEPQPGKRVLLLVQERTDLDSRVRRSVLRARGALYE